MKRAGSAGPFHNCETKSRGLLSWLGSRSSGGAGVEYAWTPNWTTKLEYNYIGSGNWSSPNTLVAGGNASYKAHIQTLVLGVNYKF